jgi:signal transduction histidine kinase
MSRMVSKKEVADMLAKALELEEKTVYAGTKGLLSDIDESEIEDKEEAKRLVKVLHDDTVRHMEMIKEMGQRLVESEKDDY